MPGLCLVAAAVALYVASLAGVLAQRSDAFGGSRDHPAILYSSAPVNDAVAQLNRRLEAGEVRLTFDADSGFLKSTLDALGVPVESQTLVFSETSLQARKISFTNPRAIYFNDTISVGWVRGGDVLEVAAQDPKQGTIFYSLRQSPVEVPQFSRDHQCLACHLSWDTRAVPGPFVMTVFPRRNDNEYANGFNVDHRVPFAERWGGWYVTGKAVPSRHMGNIALLQPSGKVPPIPSMESVAGRFDLKGYLTPYSDVVALMVLEHQAHATNLITRADWEARTGAELRALEAADELADYLLFVEEPPLPGEVRGGSGFAERFSALGPTDSRGRSLRQFDLKTRLMRYPLSYMIYSPSFDALAPEVRDAVYLRLWRVLSGADTSKKYAHLSPADRQAIIEIVRATKRNLPEAWKAS